MCNYGPPKSFAPIADVPPENPVSSKLEVRSLLTALLGPRSGDEEVSVF
jgi:hypothetical protein